MSLPSRLTLTITAALVPGLVGCHEDDPGRPDINGTPDDAADLETTTPDSVAQDAEPTDGAAPDGEQPDTTTQPLTLLTAGATSLELSLDGTSLTLLRDGGRRLTLFASDISVGTVPALDDIANYDPTYFEPNVELTALYTPPEGLSWATATAFSPKPTSRPGESAEVGLVFGARDATLTLAVRGPDRIACKLTFSDGAPAAFVRIGVRGTDDEGWYGMGEVLDSPEHRGKVRPMQILLSEKLDSGYNEVHVPVPLAIGTTGWGLFVESYRPGVFAFGTHAPDLVRATFGLGGGWQEGLTFHLFASDHALDITRLYYQTTGFPKLPAPWALGPWLWRDEVAGEAKVREDLDTIRDLDLAASGYWIDRPYASAVNSFDFDPDKYDDPAAMIARAHALGMRMALWHTPYLDPDDDATAAEHLDAKAKGYYPPVIGASTPDWGPTLDFTNPDAVAYWRGRLDAYVTLGIEGYKLDYGEEVLMGAFGIRSPWTFADGSDELTMHRRAQILYHEVYAATLPPEGGFLLVRAGGYGDQVHGPIVWPGDIDASLTLHGETVTTAGGDTYGSVGGLPAAVVAGSSLGPSGYAFFAADTGGYRNSPPSKETFLRWMAQSALTPVMQVGTNSNDLPWEFGKDRENDPVLVAQYRKFARLHLRLFPALWTWAKELASTGRAIQKPLGLAYDLRDVTPLTDGAPIDAHPDFVYLLGDELLVAPAVRPGITTVTAPLPKGTWTDLLTGAVYSGGKETVLPAPLDHIPALLRAGAILPMLRDTIDTLAPATEPGIESFVTTAGPLWVTITRFDADATRDFTLYDGTVLTLTQTTTGSATTLTLSANGGAVYDVDLVVELIGPSAKGAESAGGPLPTKAEGLAGPGLFSVPAGTRAVLPAGARSVEFTL